MVDMQLLQPNTTNTWTESRLILHAESQGQAKAKLQLKQLQKSGTTVQTLADVAGTVILSDCDAHADQACGQGFTYWHGSTLTAADGGWSVRVD